jgi:hypothetical protein
LFRSIAEQKPVIPDLPIDGDLYTGAGALYTGAGALYVFILEPDPPAIPPCQEQEPLPELWLYQPSAQY